MAMTPDSWTENSTYDKLVTAYLIIRIVVSAVMSILCGFQLFIVIREKKNLLRPRIYTLISLTGFPLFRVMYCIALFKTHNFDYGSLPLYFGMWTTYFIFNIWIWISCVWMQILYTFFISKEILFQNNKRIYILSWVISGLCLAYTVVFTLVSYYDQPISGNFYTGGFLGILVVFGIVLASNGIILSRRIVKHEKKMKSEKVTNTVSKIRKLAFTLIFIIVAALLRDLVFLLVPTDPFANIQHFSAFYTFVLETIQGIIVMIALADRPLNYFKFKEVYNTHSRGQSSDSGSGKPKTDMSNRNPSTMSIELGSLAYGTDFNTNSGAQSSGNLLTPQNSFPNLTEANTTTITIQTDENQQPQLNSSEYSITSIDQSQDQTTLNVSEQHLIKNKNSDDNSV